MRSSQILNLILFERIWIRATMLVLAFLSASLGLLGPLFQKIFVDQITQTNTRLENFFPFVFPTWVLIALGFLCIACSLFLNQLVNYLGVRESLLLQRNLAQKLYNQSLGLRTDSLEGRQLGEMVAVYTTDVPGATILMEQSFSQFLSIFFPVTLAPIALLLLFHLSWLQILIAYVVLFAINLGMALRQSHFFAVFKQLAAERVGLVNEWIQNMRPLRVLGWVTFFENKIFHVRQVETNNRIRMLANGQTMNSFSSSITFLMNVGLILILKPEDVTPGNLFALLWIVAIFLTRPFRQLPWFFTFLFDGWTSIKRVSQWLQLQNQSSFLIADSAEKLASAHDSSAAPARIHPVSETLTVENLNLTIGDQSILKKIDLEVKAGEFIVITGPVAAGKSMLLLSLLGETQAEFKRYFIGQTDILADRSLDQLKQHYSYIPQDAFIMSASLRENVAFEYDFPPSHDEQIIRSLREAQFDLSAENQHVGLETEIGERGLNLSGGQKQRVNLARINFYHSPILLLDDCLSAVDFDTEKKIIDTLLMGEWKNRTRILVTHRTRVTQFADHVYEMHEGSIRHVGLRA